MTWLLELLLLALRGLLALVGVGFGVGACSNRAGVLGAVVGVVRLLLLARVWCCIEGVRLDVAVFVVLLLLLSGVAERCCLCWFLCLERVSSFWL